MFKALIEAFLNLFKKPATGNVPPIAAGNRGLIEYGEDACIFCLKCEVACPPGAIQFLRYEDGHEKYHYNPYLCIYCGDCVRACPKPGEALWQEETLCLGGIDPQISKGWYAIEEESRESKKRYKKAKKAAATEA